MRIEIRSTKVSEKRGIGKRSGQAYLMREQQGLVQLPDRDGEPEPVPRLITVPLEEAQAAYPPGLYEVDDRSWTVDAYGKLDIRRLVLVKAVAVSGGHGSVKAA